jgi:hypothetical protein
MVPCIDGPAGRCRIDAIEPEVAEFQRIDEHIDRAFPGSMEDKTRCSAASRERLAGRLGSPVLTRGPGL